MAAEEGESGGPVWGVRRGRLEVEGEEGVVDGGFGGGGGGGLGGGEVGLVAVSGGG